VEAVGGAQEIGKLTNLKHLEITDCSNVPADGLAAIASLPNVTRLECFDFRALSSTTLSSLWPLASSLQQLSFSQGQLSSLGALSVFTALRKLRLERNVVGYDSKVTLSLSLSLLISRIVLPESFWN
jgi:hypothetical protein